MNQDFVAQLFGFLSFSLGIYAFYQKSDRKLKIIMVIFGLVHFTHFLLLGSIVSALSALLSTTRTWLSIFTSSKKMATIFIVLGIMSGVYLSESIWDMWSILGMCIGTYSMFLLKGIKMRIGFLIGATCWLINNILVGSIGGIALEATLISVNLLTIYRLSRDQKTI